MTDNSPRSTFRKLTRWISKNVFNRQVGVFLIFLCISTVLWFVTSLSEEVNRQIVCHLRITNVPDSITLISRPPSTVSANIRGRGSFLLRNLFGSPPVVSVNFRDFSNDGRLSVSRNNLLELVQSALGDENQLQGVYPDSIGIYYTWLPPQRAAVNVEVTATASPNAHILGPITAVTDSVDVYITPSLWHKIKSVSTAEVHLSGLETTRVVKVPLVQPAGARTVPDSVEVRINVEPYVTITRSHNVEAANVPKGYTVAFEPAKINASYRVPKSASAKLPEVRIVADCSELNDSVSVAKVAVSSDPWLSFIFLDTDSVTYTLSAADGND